MNFPSKQWFSERKNRLSLLTAVAATLSAGHHMLNLWGLPIWQAALFLLIFIPLMTVLFSMVSGWLWGISTSIPRGRWLLFLVPALILAGILTRIFYTSPIVWHQVQVTPVSGRQVELYELKIPPGRVVSFAKVGEADGWILEEGVFKVDGNHPAPLTYSFFGPVGENAGLLFMQSPNAGTVEILLDGVTTRVDLKNSETGYKHVDVPTGYRFGLPSLVVLIPVVLADYLSFFAFLLLLWLVQEISQLAPRSERDSFPLLHRGGLTILSGVAATLHAVYFFAVPLFILSDSSTYLEGVLHWLEFGNFDGVPSFRGPGTTFLFIPAAILFGKDPLGIKLTLHLLSIGSVWVGYRLGLQLFQRRSYAFLAGLIVLLIPEMFIYSSIVMSDMPNIFFGMLFLSLLLSALESFQWKWFLGAMLTGSFFALIRPENVAGLALGAGFLLLKIVWEYNQGKTPLVKPGAMLISSVLLAAVPLLMWSAHNQRLHGFFGLSNYGGLTLYDGWVYYGEASKLPITDKDSPAVQQIAEAFAAYDGEVNYVDVPTGWELYPTLIAHGYTRQEALDLLGQAAKDSVRKHPDLAARLLVIKIKDALAPESIAMFTFLTPEELALLNEQEDEPSLLDPERPIFPSLIPLQRAAFDWLEGWYATFYHPLVLFCTAVMFLALYQKRFFVWMPVITYTIARILIPIVIVLGNWRYVVSSVPILLLFFLLAIQMAAGFSSALRQPAARG